MRVIKRVVFIGFRTGTVSFFTDRVPVAESTPETSTSGTMEYRLVKRGQAILLEILLAKRQIHGT
jgi:hypothetical protein